ncbi:MAG: hypothetical protein A3A65_03260 [Candidatus Chisholmbacteria bacterium RIFCSPLOWO2_01_FULL_49_14]|uniref:Transposase IS200-like domain-containing protein n=1 Tax=Candidatus Chisholmbacteria bacterium RIFCSPLOWO2_01_FULL_49_14 TaxID=1797593 RepID=A0A1G1W097_9BACT|nr:MAG: hypothetical protein A3A65_03260 [Candidatus Chisholmbacteria bacterium RIFCSPLOWO2_01_FULL_49_14]
MPHKHRVKVYVENGYYHAYNRGVEKRKIFKDDQDYKVFLYLLKYYLSPKQKDLKHPLAEIPEVSIIRPRPLTNMGKEIELCAYCLMPNHFHLLMKQKTKLGMPKFLQKLSTTYAMYFNRRYKRVGYLFQGNYKAALILEDAHLLHLSRYIHLNPTKLTGPSPVSYPYSSYSYYLGKKKAPWVKPHFILTYFDNSRNHPNLNKYLSYQEFVEGNKSDPKEAIHALSID